MKCWVVICETGSCSVSAVYLSKEKAERWVKKVNKKFGFEAYYVEQSQVIKKKEVK